MLGFARKLLYRTASAIERRGDKNYYFLGFENKIDHIHAFDLLLKLFERKSAGAERKFWRLVDIAAEMDESDLVSFKLKTAISGAGFFSERQYPRRNLLHPFGNGRGYGFPVLHPGPETDPEVRRFRGLRSGCRSVRTETVQICQ